MSQHFSYTLVSPQTGNLGFKLFSLEEDNNQFNHIQRLGYFSLILIKKGKGNVKADFNNHFFEGNTFLSFSPYQPFMIETEEKIEGTCIFFHPEFFCIYNHMKDVACDGVLFDNIYNPPLISLKETQVSYLQGLLDQIQEEMPMTSFAKSDMIVSMLRIYMIYVSRIKLDNQKEASRIVLEDEEPFVLKNLKSTIESNYKIKHSASDYAELLNISSVALAKACKKYYQKTLTNLISERIIIEAKRELYLTSKPIKEIAYDLGYDDEYYFSRFFKKNAEVSPRLYRETVGFS